VKQAPVTDPFTGETFARVVGRRVRPPPGEPPTADARAALDSFAARLTAAPKGVFRYRSHEEMDEDRTLWTVEAMVRAARHG
jgi:hypothetical protein